MTRTAFALLAVWLTSMGARAEDANAADMVGAFYPEAFSRHLARDQASARALERVLGDLSGVEQARVLWTRKDPSQVPLDQPLAPASLMVALQISDSGPRQDELDAVLENLLAAETPRPSLQLVKTTAKKADFARSPTQHETNESALRTVLALSLAANVLLATVLLLRARARA